MQTEVVCDKVILSGLFCLIGELIYLISTCMLQRLFIGEANERPPKWLQYRWSIPGIIRIKHLFKVNNEILMWQTIYKCFVLLFA